MATVNGFSAERMLDIENKTVVQGNVNFNGDLILETRDGTLINAGPVRGADAEPLLQISDTPTIDLTLSGGGVIGNPWGLSAHVKALPDTAVVKGLLEANYRGGPAKVKVNGVLSSEAYNWMTPYNPSKSREVNLMKLGSSWVIMGQNTDGYHAIELANKWFNHAARTNNATFAIKPRAVRLSSGLVVLSGLIRNDNTPPADGTLIFTLPPSHRPDHDILYPIERNDVAGAIRIGSNGNVTVYGSGWVANGYVSLDGIAFWAAGVADWIPIDSFGSSFGANFERNPAWDNFGPPSFWKDPYGFVWFKGIVRVKTAVSTDNTRIINLPTDYRAWRENHFRTTGMAYYSGIGAQPSNGLNWKPNSHGSIGNWISLEPVVLDTIESRANNPWFEVPVFSNGWAQHGSTATYPAVSYLLREDGLVMNSGIVSGGTSSALYAALKDPELWPSEGRAIIPIISNNDRARLDVGSVRDTLNTANGPGSLVLSQGTNWHSVDGVFWIP